jgi:hypothetical protein
MQMAPGCDMSTRSVFGAGMPFRSESSFIALWRSAIGIPIRVLDQFSSRIVSDAFWWLMGSDYLSGEIPMC